MNTAPPTPEQPKLSLVILPVTPLRQQCSLLWHTETLEGVLIDPGGEVDKILDAVKHFGVTIRQVWLTHGHLDHAGGAADIRERLGAEIIGPHKDDQFWLDRIEESGANYGIADGRDVTPDRYLNDGDTLNIGEYEFGVIHAPGHTPGHVIFYNEELKISFVGDVIFQGSIGRTDFPRGNHQQLIDSITQKLWPLGDDMAFYSGHTPVSTFGQERKTNPFVADSVLGR